MIIERGSQWRWKAETGRFFTKGRIYTALSDGKPGESFHIEDDLSRHGDEDSPHTWTNDPDFFAHFERADGPVRTVTRKEIVAGRFGLVEIEDKGAIVTEGGVSLWLPRNHRYSQAELRATAATLVEIADAMEPTP